MQPSEAVLDDLGVSMDTFRRIRNLQAREITANDYDLLMRLHSKPSIKVRTRPRFRPSASSLPDSKPLKRAPPHHRFFAIFVLTYNSLAAPQVLDEEQLEACTETFTASTASAAAGESCAVCLGTMSPGEKLCRLACDGGHTFHAHCIGEWLRTASRCCPVDQQDLAVIGLSA